MYFVNFRQNYCVIKLSFFIIADDSSKILLQRREFYLASYANQNTSPVNRIIKNSANEIIFDIMKFSLF